MALNYTSEAEAFRAELRTWLAKNLDDDEREAAKHTADNPQRIDLLRRWQARLADAGYAAVAWPKEYGGRGAGVLEQVVHAEEMDAAGAPPDLNPVGMSNIAPAIMQWGTDGQKRTLLPRMLRGEDIWCQGFSEPDAGSDLASVRTTATGDGEHFFINGQKVWTTLAHVSAWCELLVRTDPEATKHRGLSTFLIDMTLPGIEVRPLRTMTGEHEFNEIFFSDVRVPASALLGPLNEGWRVAMTTLNYERAGVLKLYLAVRRRVRELADAARELGRLDDPSARRAVTRCAVEAEYLRLLSERSVQDQLDGQEVGPEAALAKLFWSSIEQHIAETAAHVLGDAANSGRFGLQRVYVPAVSVAGGTTQVNKNVIAQRVLGLPRS